MPLNYEDEIAQYKKQLETKIKEIETRRTLFNKSARKLNQIKQRLTKAAHDYQEEYDSLITSGITIPEARTNGVDSLTSVLRTIADDTKTITNDNTHTQHNQTMPPDNQPDDHPETNTAYPIDNTNTYTPENTQTDNQY